MAMRHIIGIALSPPASTMNPSVLCLRRCVALAALTTACAVHAQTTVKDPWIRATVAQQMGTGMFAQITSLQGGTLVSASSPVASMVEIHEMAMQGDVMTMRELGKGLPLPAGKTVALKAGGYHLMMMGLKKQLKSGELVPVTLVIEGPDKKRETVEVKALVRSLASGAGTHKQ
jgi:periplasmic copper chaperone A